MRSGPKNSRPPAPAMASWLPRDQANPLPDTTTRTTSMGIAAKIRKAEVTLFSERSG